VLRTPRGRTGSRQHRTVAIQHDERRLLIGEPAERRKRDDAVRSNDHKPTQIMADAREPRLPTWCADPILYDQMTAIDADGDAIGTIDDSRPHVTATWTFQLVWGLSNGVVVLAKQVITGAEGILVEDPRAFLTVRGSLVTFRRPLRRLLKRSYGKIPRGDFHCRSALDSWLLWLFVKPDDAIGVGNEGDYCV
jgi:hypothetical protein